MTALLALAAAIQPPHAYGQDPVVYRIRVTGAIELNTSEIVDRALAAAAGEPGAVVILDFESRGGRVDIAQLIANDLRASPVPVYTLVNSRALGAAALVALATDSIFMVPGSSIGGGSEAELRDIAPNALRAMRRNFGELVERRGLDPLIGEAMVDKGIEIPNLVSSQELLSLEADAAVRINLAAASVDNLTELVTRLELNDAEIVTVGTGWTGTTVEVRNFNVMDARIYVFRGSVRYRLGNVTSMGSADFDVPESFLPQGSRIRVVAELIGSSERTATEEVAVQPGLIVQWVLEARLSQSSYFFVVRP